jgi:hypothetical protein
MIASKKLNFLVILSQSRIFYDCIKKIELSRRVAPQSRIFYDCIKKIEKLIYFKYNSSLFNINLFIFSMSTCKSIRSPTESHLQCMFHSDKGSRYCPLHLSYESVTDYENKVREIKTEKNFTEKKANPIYTFYEIPNKKSDVVVGETKTVRVVKGGKRAPMREQKTSNVIASHQDNENILEVKMLIMLNDDEFVESMPQLLGPAFHDITLSEDQDDPVTMDKFWEIINGKKIPLFDNKYYVFSYSDSKGKIRCLTVFTLYDMIESGDYTHPVTTELMSDEDIDRAKKLIDIYSSKLDLFSQTPTENTSPEYALKNRISKLFKQFHVHSIYFEESWLLNVSNMDNLIKIDVATKRLANNNVRSICESRASLTFPVCDMKRKTKTKSNWNEKITYSKEEITKMQSYIVDVWEFLISTANNINNQIPIWIIAHGLSGVVPEVMAKYPDLAEMMR